jgi:hypothetical protein
VLARYRDPGARSGSVGDLLAELGFTRESWMRRGSCAGLDPGLFAAEQHIIHAPPQLAEMCASCPVLAPCDDHARRTAATGVWQAGAYRRRGKPLSPRSDPLCELGFGPDEAHRARVLAAEHASTNWEMGDLLVEVLGPPPASGVMDGSRELLDTVSCQLGCSVSWLTAVRIAAAAWPEEERRSGVGWTLHRALSAREDRGILLDTFVGSCRQQSERPTVRNLHAWLGRHTLPPESKRGRPRLDRVERVLAEARKLTADEVQRLIEALGALLVEAAA